MDFQENFHFFVLFRKKSSSFPNQIENFSKKETKKEK